MRIENMQGCLLAAHPKNNDLQLKKGVLLVLDHSPGGALALQINKPFTNEITLKTIMQNLGLHTDLDHPIYFGGEESSNRIHVIHSLDWFTANTNKITEDIGISHDVSIMAAISKHEGPDEFRVIAGLTRWEPGQLEGELRGLPPWRNTDSWSWSTATVNTVFGYDEIEQWREVIAEASSIQVRSWF